MLLSRTAENLFWIARYIERAETMARLLEVGARNALMPNTGGGYRNEWESVLQASGTARRLRRQVRRTVQRNVETHLFFDRDNPSSVASCIARARENGRIVRTALTTPGLGRAELGLPGGARAAADRARRSSTCRDLIDWTLRTTALIRGAIDATQLRNDG